ncbi:MAG: polysulfide reductase NrfD [Candidatus Bathyarchaeota archaeon]|nr:polysulfide reductase NrfD [Candidatus Bathyarchaeota archaeon]
MTDIVWGWQLTLEIFLVGLGAAAIIISLFADLIKKDQTSYVAMAGAYIAPVATVMGILVLILHLGALYRAPWNILHIIFEPNIESQLATRTWALIILTVLMVMIFALCLFKGSQKLTFVLKGAASIVAFYVLVNGGVVLSFSRGVPFWSTPVLPWILTISSFPAALASIGLAIPILAQLMPKLFTNMVEIFNSGKNYKKLTLDLLTASIPFLVATLILTFAHIALAYGEPGVDVMLMGDMAMFFWAYVVAGTIVPIIIWVLNRSTTTKSAWANYLSYLLILAGMAALNFAILYSPQITESILNF